MFGRKIDQEERDKCLSYLQEEMKMIAFREIEQSLFDEVFIQYYRQDYEKKGDMTREQLTNASKRVVEAAKEILRRRQSMLPVPDIASSMFYAYQRRFEDYLDLKEKQADSVTSFISVSGTADRLQESMTAEKRSRDVTLKEEKKLWRKLKLGDSEVMKMRNDAVAAVKAENWQPKKRR